MIALPTRGEITQRIVFGEKFMQWGRNSCLYMSLIVACFHREFMFIGEACEVLYDFCSYVGSVEFLPLLEELGIDLSFG